MTAVADPASRASLASDAIVGSRAVGGDGDRSEETRHDLRVARYVGLAVIGVIIVLTAIHLQRSLWSDEMSTVWFSGEGWATTTLRLDAFGSNSPVYPIVMSAWMALVGAEPFLIRIPSVLGVALAALVVFRTARELDKPATGWIALSLFLVSSDAFVAAGNARVYAIALPFLALAHQSVLRWLADGSDRHSVRAVGFAAAAAYLHILMVLAIVPFLVAVALRRRRSPDLVRELRRPALIGVVLFTPYLVLGYSAMSNSGYYAPWLDPRLETAIERFGQPFMIIVLLTAVVLAVVQRSETIRSDAFAYLVAASVIPVALSYSLATSMGLGVWGARYLVGIIPALALMSALALAAVRPSAVRAVLLVSLVLLATLRIASAAGVSQSWEQAVVWTNDATAGRDAVVLVEPIHVSGRAEDLFTGSAGQWVFEGQDSLEWVNPIEAGHPLDAPFYGLPWAATSWGVDYLDAVLDARVLGYDMVVLIGHEYLVDTDYSDLVRARLATAGYVEQPSPELDREVLVFERQPA